MADASCYSHLLTPGAEGVPAQIAVVRDEAAAVERAMQRPAEIDAVLVFDHAHRVADVDGGGAGSWDSRELGARTSGARAYEDVGGGGHGGGAGAEMDRSGGHEAHSAGGEAGAPDSLAHSLLEYRIRINHTDIPPTEFLYDMFDVVPDPFRQNGLMLYKR